MADIRLIHHSKVPLHLVACDYVGLCLCCDWATKTVTGNSLVQARVTERGRRLGPVSIFNHFLNVRKLPLYQYEFIVDDAQFIENPETPGVPYQPDCSDIRDVFPYDCVTNSIVNQ